MNLAEGITFILKNRSQNLLQDFLRDDIASVIGHVVSDGARMFRESRDGLKNIDVKNLPRDIYSSATEIAQLVKVLPSRIKNGLTGFQEDMLSEINMISDPKDKAIFCLRVLGILATSSVTTFYNIKSTGKSLSPGKLNFRSAFAQFLLAEIVFRSIRLFALRLVTELDKIVTNEEDQDHLRYFRRVLDGDGDTETSPVSEEDPAFRIIEKLKKIILNGDDEA